MPRPLGLSREARILLPLALLLLIVLSTFTLFSYREGVTRLTDERREQATQASRRVAEALARADRAQVEILRLRAPEARRVTVTDGKGRTLLQTGDPVLADALAPLAGQLPERPVGLGPGKGLMDTVAGFAPWVGVDGTRRWVRVDLAAEGLGAQRRSLRVLSWVVLGLNAALGILVMLYLRHWIGPWERLLARAREVDPKEDTGDETSFLISTFERAVRALESSKSAAPEPDLAALETLEKTLSESLESGLLLLDPQGAVLGSNSLGREILGVPEPDVGVPMERALGSRPVLLDTLREAVGTGQGIRRRELSIAEDDERVLGLSVHPLRRDDGIVRGFLVLFADLTESKRRAAEDRLSESLEQLGELAAGVAHELRNGLATLEGYLTLIERRPDDDSVGDYLLEMRRETRELERVLNDFLAFARPGAARVEPVALAGLLHRVVADPALPGDRLRVDEAVDGTIGVVRVDADPQLLGRALKNLVLNAVQAAPEGTVLLSLHRSGGEGADEADRGIEIRVEDAGPGIPPELAERIFQPFVSGRPDGVGLGLALAHRIVALHGGTLRLEDRPGGGTRAVVRLPPDKIVTNGNDAPASLQDPVSG